MQLDIDGHPPAPVDDGPSDDIDALVDHMQPPPPLVDRDDEGQFLGDSNRRRTRHPMNVPRGFAIIEERELEAEHCYGNQDDVPAECLAPRRCTAHGGFQCRQWLIREPVRGWSDDGWRLSTVTIVRALATIPQHEVYVRSMGYLVPGTYVDAEDAYESVRFVAMAQSQENLSWDTTSPKSSYRGLVAKQDLDDDHIKTILRQAATIMRVAAKRLPNGHVTLLRLMSAIKDPVNKKHLKALLRQRSARAVAHYRLTGATEMKTAWYKLLHNVGAGVVAIIRRVLEIEKSNRPGLTGKRSTRIRLGWGATQMRLLPTPAQLREERRRTFDNEDRIAHFFFTRDGPGKLVQWDYI